MRTLAMGLFLCLAAAADEVILKTGGKFSGLVEERGLKVLVRTEHGVLTFDRSDVDRIDRSKSSPLQEYQERLSKIDVTKAEEVGALLAWAETRRMAEGVRELRDRLCRLKWDQLNHADPEAATAFAAWARANGCKEQAALALRASIGLQKATLEKKDAGGHYRLGLWAKSNGMPAEALVLFQQAILADPDHEHARREMGFQKVDGVWLTEREVKIAKGLIEFEGEWMTPQAKEGILLARTLEKERRLLEQERKKAELARAEARREKAEMEARALDLARQAAELERRRQEPPLPHHVCGFGCGHTVIYTPPPPPSPAPPPPPPTPGGTQVWDLKR
jgi:tetratricopeptide (TPR) repeat protein